MKWAAGLCFALVASPALAEASVDFKYENFTVERGIAQIVMKVTNKGNVEATRVYIDCTFMNDKGKAVDIGKAVVTVPARSHAFTKAAIATDEKITDAECQIAR